MKVFQKSVYPFYMPENKEIEKSLLIVKKAIISIDGVDGSGKSSISKILVQTLNERQIKAVLVKFNLGGSGEGENRIKNILENKKPNENSISGLIAAGINRTYKERVLPLLNKGFVVVLDRSEIDLLRFAIEKGDKELLEKRTRYIKSGYLTHNLWAGNRVFVSANSEDVWENLQDRANFSKSDPVSLDEVKSRIEAEKVAEGLAEKIDVVGEVNFIRIENKRVRDFQIQFHDLSEIVFEKLDFG